MKESIHPNTIVLAVLLHISTWHEVGCCVHRAAKHDVIVFVLLQGEETDNAHFCNDVI